MPILRSNMNQKLDEIISLLKEIKQALVGEKKDTTSTRTLADDPTRRYGGGGYVGPCNVFYAGDTAPSTTYNVRNKTHPA